MSLGARAHTATVSEDAKEALAFLKTPARNLASVRCVTPSGKVLKSFTPYTIDGETDRVSIKTKTKFKLIHLISMKQTMTKSWRLA